VFDTECSSCGVSLQHPTWSPWPGVRRHVKRALRAALVTGVLVVAPTLFFLSRYARRSDVQHWKLGARIDELASADSPDWQQIRVLSRQLVDLQPRNPRGWYLLALSGHRLGYHPRLAIREALEALRLRPGLGEARLFVATELARVGEYPAARDHAAQALLWSFAPPEAWLLAGELELQRVRPDVTAALALMEEARRRGLESVELDVRIALLRQRQVGIVAPERYPPELTVALSRAAASLERAGDGEMPPGVLEWFRAELAFAEGRLSDAETQAVLGLGRIADEPESAVLRARLHTAQARVALVRRQDSEAAEALRAALAASRQPEIVGTIDQLTRAVGREDLARTALAAVAPEADGDGTARAALAELHRRAGRLAEAEKAATEAVAAATGDAALLLLLGDVRRDRNDTAGARSAYEAALAAGGDQLPARIRLALLRLVSPGEDLPARASAVVDDLKRLRESGHGEFVPALEAAIGRSLVVAGRHDEAVRVLENVVRATPWSAGAWLDLAAAWRGADAPDAVVRAASCASEAARMAPFDRSVVLEVARAGARNGDDALVVLTTTAYLERVTDDTAVLRQRAEARLRLAEWSAAVRDLEAVRRLGDDALVVRLQLADAYVRAGREDAAWELVRGAADAGDRRALEIVMASLEARELPTGFEFSSAVAVAVGHVREGAPEQALDVLREARAAEPRDPSVARALVLLLCGPELADLDRDERLREARAAVDSIGGTAGSGLLALLRGRIALASGRTEEAADHLRDAVVAMPWDASAHVWRGEAAFEGGDDAAARAAYVRASWLPGGRAAYGDVLAARLLALALRAPGDGTPRTKLLREALRADPGLTEASEHLFDTLFARGAFRDAADAAERALAVPRTAGDAARRAEVSLRRRALAARLELGDVEAVGRHLDALEAAGGELERPDTVRGLVALGRGRVDEAAARFRAALEADADDGLAAVGFAEALVRRGDADAALAFVRGRLDERPDELPLAHVVVRSLVRAGRPEAAARVSADVIGRAPDDVPTIRQRVWVLGLCGRADEARATARDRARAAREADDSDTDRAAHLDVLAAECLLQLSGRAEEGLAEARALADDPAVPGTVRHEARLVIAEALVDLGRAEEAAAELLGLTSAWESDRPVTPHDRLLEPRVRFVRGMVAVLRGRLEPAAEEFLLALQLDPVHHAAANNAAWCIAQGDAASPAALDLARRATAGAPEAATYWDTRALCERGAGLWDEALSSWQRAGELLTAQGAAPGEIAEVLLRRAELLLDLRRHAEARQEAARILDVAPESPEATRARAIAGRN
jgi:tetratricopeptide (TPR) repeat protein